MEGRNSFTTKKTDSKSELKSTFTLGSVQRKISENKPKVKKRYSNPVSCSLHTKLFRVIDDEYDIRAFANDIRNTFDTNPDALERTSETGHTLVIDMLHLPHVDRKDNSRCENPTILSRDFFSVISSLCKENITNEKQRKALKTLLIDGSNNGYNPLTQILSNETDIQLLQTYLSTLKTALKKKIISKPDIQQLFRLAIRSTGNTALHLGAQSGNCEVLNLLVDFLKSFNDVRMIQELLAIQNTSQKLTPFCSNHLPAADAINDYLDQLSKGNLNAPAPHALASSSESETDDNNVVVEFKPVKPVKCKAVKVKNVFDALEEEDDLDSEDNASDSEDNVSDFEGNIPDLEDAGESHSPLLNKKSQQKTQPTSTKKMTVEKKNTSAPVKKAETNNVSVTVKNTKAKPPRDCCSMITGALCSFFTRQSTPQTTYLVSDVQTKKKL